MRSFIVVAKKKARARQQTKKEGDDEIDEIEEKAQEEKEAPLKRPKKVKGLLMTVDLTGAKNGDFLIGQKEAKCGAEGGIFRVWFGNVDNVDENHRAFQFLSHH